WDFGDGHTTLIAAGPSRSGDRPAARSEHGVPTRHIVDWLPTIASAARDTLQGCVEAALREALALLERGVPPAEVAGEARAVGQQARLRLDQLDAARLRARQAPDPALRSDMEAVVQALASGSTSTASSEAQQVFGAVLRALQGAAPQAGWSGSAADS